MDGLEEEKCQEMLSDPTHCWWRIYCREEIGLTELPPCPIKIMAKADIKKKENERLNRESGLI